MTKQGKEAFGFSEFADMFSISRDSAKRLWRCGDLATITIGGRRLIPSSEVERIAREGIGTPRKRKRTSRGETECQIKQKIEGRSQ